jgi:hypothetical protein
MSRLVVFALVCLVLGAVLLTVLKLTIPGVVLLFAFVVAGVFAIADPAFLSEEE